MKTKTTVALVSALMLLIVSFGRSIAAEPTAREAISAKYAQLDAAVLNGPDATQSWFEANMDPGFRFIVPDSPVQSRQQFISRFMAMYKGDPGLKVKVQKFTIRSFRHIAPYAVVRLRSRCVYEVPVKPSQSGQERSTHPVTIDATYRETWVYLDGEWKLIKSQVLESGVGKYVK